MERFFLISGVIIFIAVVVLVLFLPSKKGGKRNNEKNEVPDYEQWGDGDPYESGTYGNWYYDRDAGWLPPENK